MKLAIASQRSLRDGSSCPADSFWFLPYLYFPPSLTREFCDTYCRPVDTILQTQEQHPTVLTSTHTGNKKAEHTLCLDCPVLENSLSTLGLLKTQINNYLIFKKCFCQE